MSSFPQSKFDPDYLVDPDVEAIAIWATAGDDEGKIAAVHESLLGEQERGWCTILYMDQRIAIVQWRDAFVLTISDQAMPVAASDMEV